MAQHRLYGHADPVHAVAAEALPDDTPVIISGGFDDTMRVWRLADATPLGLRDPIRGVAVHGSIIVAAAGADIAIQQPAFPRPMR